VHAGVSAVAADPRDLPRSLEQALLALEWAVHKGHGAVLYEDEAERHATTEATPFEAVPLLLRAVASGDRAHRDRALERLASEIVWKSGSLLVAARAYAETIHAQVVHLVRQIGSIEERAIADHVVAFRRALGRSRSATEVAGLLRDYVTAITEARRDAAGRGLARATAYIDEHLAEALTAREVARIAGYSPDHFTRLLRAHLGRTFEKFLLERRIARAKELLRTTDLPVARVFAASGFRTEAYFFRAFRRAVGPTPLAFRQAARRPASANRG
jgi:AraC-like DNA-binding protein